MTGWPVPSRDIRAGQRFSWHRRYHGLVDRLGQTRIVVPTTIISVLRFRGLIAAANQDCRCGRCSCRPCWLPHASMPELVRARWTDFRGRPR